MKQCPQCGREYDSSMMFCLDDGVELLYGSASADEPTAAILHRSAAPSEAATRAQSHLTDQTAVLPTGVEHVVHRPRGIDKRLFVAPLRGDPRFAVLAKRLDLPK